MVPRTPPSQPYDPSNAYSASAIAGSIHRSLQALLHNSEVGLRLEIMSFRICVAFHKSMPDSSTSCIEAMNTP